MIDHLFDDLDHFNTFFRPLLALDLKRAALRLVQNVGTEQSRKVVRVHLVAWQLYHIKLYHCITYDYDFKNK